MRFLSIVVPGKPKAWARTGGAPGGMRFETKQQKNNKGVLQVHAIEAIRKTGEHWPLDAMYVVYIDAYWACPKTQHRKNSPRKLRPRTGAPDCDNLAKLIGDALEYVVWENDRTIVAMHTRKWTAPQGAPARTEILVVALGPEDEWDKYIVRPI